MSVCRRERKREREREKAIWGVFHSVHLNVSKSTIITASLLVTRVTSDRAEGILL
jgi:hypothetical protein